MSEIQKKNPFLEYSEVVPTDEAAAAVKLLIKEAQAAHKRAIIFKEKLAKAKAEKEQADKERAAKEQAAIDAARAHIIKTIATIPRNSGQSTLRPAARNSEITLTSSDKNPFYLPDQSISVQSFATDAAVAVIALTFTFLMLIDTIPFLS